MLSSFCKCLFSSRNLKMSLDCCVCCLCIPSSSNRFGSTANRLVVMIDDSRDEDSTHLHRLIALPLSPYCWPFQRHRHASITCRYSSECLQYIISMTRDWYRILACSPLPHRRTTEYSKGDKILLPPRKSTTTTADGGQPLLIRINSPATWRVLLCILDKLRWQHSLMTTDLLLISHHQIFFWIFILF